MVKCEIITWESVFYFIFYNFVGLHKKNTVLHIFDYDRHLNLATDVVHIIILHTYTYNKKSKREKG